MTDYTAQLNTQANDLLELIMAQQTYCHVNSSTSTNTELMTQVLDGALDSSLIHVLTANTQTAGRGQKGRSWQSPKGNVYLSLYYPVKQSSHPLTQPISGLLSLCVGYYLSQLPIIQLINQHIKVPIGVKWANDIGFYDFNMTKKGDEKFKVQTHIQFCKLAGILIEPVVKQGKTLGVIVGVGLNVAAAPDLSTITQEDMTYQSTCLNALLNDVNLSGVNDPGTVSDYKGLYQPIMNAIVKALLRHQYMSHSINAQDLQHFLQQFSAVDVLKGYQIKVSNDSGNRKSNQNNFILGVAKGIDQQGCLQLQDDNGRVHSLFSGKIEVVSKIS